MPFLELTAKQSRASWEEQIPAERSTHQESQGNKGILHFKLESIHLLTFHMQTDSFEDYHYLCVFVMTVSAPTEIVSALQHLRDVDVGGPLGDLHDLMIADFG